MSAICDSDWLFGSTAAINTFPPQDSIASLFDTNRKDSLTETAVGSPICYLSLVNVFSCRDHWLWLDFLLLKTECCRRPLLYSESKSESAPASSHLNESLWPQIRSSVD
jgi:hypothetical protein